MANSPIMGRPGNAAVSIIDVRKILVGVIGFEPTTPSFRTRYATRLRYTPRPVAAL